MGFDPDKFIADEATEEKPTEGVKEIKDFDPDAFVGDEPVEDKPKEEFDREAYKRSIAEIESNGDYSAENPDPGTSAKGKYQFVDATRKEIAKRLGVDPDELLGNSERAKDLQEKAMDLLVDEQKAQVSKIRKKGLGKDLTDAEIMAGIHARGLTGFTTALLEGKDPMEGVAGNSSVFDYIKKFSGTDSKKDKGFDPEEFTDKEEVKKSVDQRASDIAAKYNVDPEFVREAFQWMGEVTTKEADKPDTLGDYGRVSAGALMRSFGAAIPQAAYRLLESDPDKKKALEEVAKSVFENQTGLDLAADVVGGMVAGGGLLKGVGLAGKAVGAGAKAINTAKTVAGLAETSAGVAAAFPGEEVKGGLLGLGLAGLATTIPGTYRVAKSMLGKEATKEVAEETSEAVVKQAGKMTDAEIDAFNQYIKEDSEALINKAEKVLEESGEEIEAVGKVLESDSVKKSMVELFNSDEKTAFTAFRDNIAADDTTRAELSNILSLRQIKPPSKKEIADLMEEKITRLNRTNTAEFSPNEKAAFEKWKEFVQTKQKDILDEYESIRYNFRTDPAAKLKAHKLEMQIKGFKGTVEDYVSFKQLRSDVSRLVREADPRLKSLNLSDPKDLKKLRKYADEALRQGKVDGDSYRRMLLKEEMIRKLEAENVARELGSGKAVKDPAKNLFKEWLYTTRYMAADVDQQLNVGIGESVDRLISAYNDKTVLASKWGRLGEELYEVSTKEGVDVTKIARALENPEELAGLNKVEKQLVGDYRNLYNRIRHEANTTYGKNIPKIEDYLPQQALPLKELIPATKTKMEAVAAKLEAAGFEDTTDLDLIRKFLKEDVLSEADRRTAKELLELSDVTSRLIDTEVTNIGDLRKVLDAIDPETFMKTRANFNAGAAFARMGEMPGWARDWRADRLLLNYIDDMADSAAMGKAISEMNSKIAVLEAAGMNDSAKWFKDYISNVGGVRLGIRKKLEQSEVPDMIANIMGIRTETLKEVMNRSIQTIYPAYLGFNLKAILRDSTQPFYMTATEIAGSGATHAYGQGLAVKAFKKLGGAIKDRGAMARELRSRGLATDMFRGDMRDQVRSALKADLPPQMAKVDTFITKVENSAMYLYSQMDYQNRFVSMKMADELGDDLVQGALALMAKYEPTEASKNAMKFISGMEPGPREAVRRKLKNALRGSGPTEEQVFEIQNELASYLINKTQLTYGTVGMAQVGRFLGPIFSMFTTWPTNIASEIVYEYARGGVTKGSVRAMKKLIAPAIATFAVKKGIEEVAGEKVEDSPRLKQIYSDPSPLYAAFDVVNFANPPALELPARAAAAAYELATGNPDRAEKAAGKAIEKAARAHIPVISTMWNSFDRYYELISDEKSPTKK